MNSSKDVAILFPNQLFKNNPALKKNRKVYLVEEYLFFTQFKFHKKKILLHRVSMKEYEKFLMEENFNLTYIHSYEKDHDIRILLPKLLDKFSEFYFINPVDDYLKKRILKALPDAKVTFLNNPNFLNSSDDIQIEKKKKKYFQTEFYKRSRIKFNILIEKDGSPSGGKWSFDSENRKKIPDNIKIPSLPEVPESEFLDESIKYINKYYKNNPGNIDNFFYAYNFNGANLYLKEFIKYKLKNFGIYEDAISTKNPYLFHSLLTPALNIGLINPDEVIKEVLRNSKDIPINSLEGFIRQIIGWREFIRLVYELEGSKERTTNFWNLSNIIPVEFYTGNSGIEPIDFIINGILNSGYCHHIERLMILGNFFLLCEIHPDNVYKWFMELFIDSYDWVMVPNVYGMSQFADGGIMSTKPYISGSNYIKKMGNFKKGNWEKIWDGLFWRFLIKHRDFFLKNPRLSMLVRSWDKMELSKRDTHLLNAENYLNSLFKKE